MNFKSKKEKERTARFVDGGRGIRYGVAIATRRWTRKRRGPLHPSRAQICTLAKPASILHRSVVALLHSSPRSMVQRTVVRLSFWFVSFFFPSPSPQASFSFSLLLSYTASLPRLPRGASQGWIFDHERASEFRISDDSRRRYSRGSKLLGIKTCMRCRASSRRWMIMALLGGAFYIAMEREIALKK